VFFIVKNRGVIVNLAQHYLTNLISERKKPPIVHALYTFAWLKQSLQIYLTTGGIG